MKTISLFICILILGGCKSKYRTDAIDATNSGIYRYYDNENNVICYTVYDKGISCIQLKGDKHEQK